MQTLVRRLGLALLISAVLATACAPAPADLGSVAFLSTQANPVEEAEKMRSVILADFSGTVDFITSEEGPFIDRVLAETQAGRGTVDILGALHGSFPPLLEAGALQDLTPLLGRLGDRGIPQAFLELGKLGTDKQYYIPWMQATYILVATNEALDYLPAGADPNALTWEQYRDWAKNIFEATGERKVGFPVDGLFHRWLQGYIYPSYTGGMVSRFSSPEAEEMWEFVVDLWQYIHPQSITYQFMQEPLLAEEVWVAWDHTARLINAVNERPDDFVTLPSPSGPQGLGFMPVIAGLAIPATAPNQAGAEALIEYLTRPEVQITTLEQIAFFPVVAADLPADLPEGVQLEGDAVARQAASPDALPALLPVGLGARGGEINQIFRNAFTRIVQNGEDIRTALEQEAANLRALMNDTGAPCWPPDPPSDGPCQVS